MAGREQERPGAARAASFRSRAAAALAALWLGACAPAGAQMGAQVATPDAAQVDATLDQLFGAHAPYRSFLAALQQAVAADDRQAVAGLVSYPLTARIGGAPLTVADPQAFLAAWDRIMTPQVRQAIAAQRYGTLFANDQGAMIGDGEVWFSEADGAVKIIGING